MVNTHIVVLFLLICIRKVNNLLTIDIIYNSLDLDSIFFSEISLGNAIVHDDIL